MHIRISADRERIGQVITNLISNAIKYSPGSNNVKIIIFKKKRNVVFSIPDFGYGIPFEDQKKIFERFYQNNLPENKGDLSLGLGLYISSEIIKQHNGNIWVESKQGQGSKFYFSLPLTNQ